MRSSLTISRKKAGDKLTIRLDGHIDASANFSDVSLDGVKKILIDFQKVTLVNSMGSLKWVAFMRNIPKEIDVTFGKCSHSVVHQLNLIPDFTLNKRAKVVSFMAPFFCKTCEQTQDMLIKSKTVLTKKGEPKIPPFNCPNCNDSMEFDAIESQYFQFLR